MAAKESLSDATAKTNCQDGGLLGKALAYFSNNDILQLPFLDASLRFLNRKAWFAIVQARYFNY
jgi:hypothetical protein